MLALNIQFFHGDRTQAMELAKLIADIEPAFRPDIEVVFSARFDTPHDKPTIDYVSKKFKVFTYTSTRRSTGWPRGPNALFADSYQFCIEAIRSRKMKSEAILFIEADCIPLDTNWINHLITEYKACGKMVLGAWLELGDCGCRHINGNCIIHKDLWKKNRKILTPARGAWDSDCSNLLLSNGAPSRLIWSDYHLGTDRNPWKGCDSLWDTRRYRDPRNPLYGQNVNPVWLHGPKDMRGIQCVRDRFINPPFLKNRDNMGQLLNRMGLLGVGVEVGVFKGENAEKILESWKGQKLILVDPWITHPKEEYVDETNKADFDSALEETIKRVERFKERFEIRRVKSEDFKPAPSAYDFVYLDAKHDYKSVVQDLEIWWPSVRHGGLFGGHDYLHKSSPDGIFDCGVTEAVDEFVLKHNLSLHVTRDDEVKSWFVVKK